MNLEQQRQIQQRKKLRPARLKLGLTQQEVAERAGITQQALSAIEAELVFPRIDTLCKILDVFSAERKALKNRKTLRGRKLP